MWDKFRNCCHTTKSGTLKLPLPTSKINFPPKDSLSPAHVVKEDEQKRFKQKSSIPVLASPVATSARYR